MAATQICSHCGQFDWQCNASWTCTALGCANWETFNPTTAAHARGTAQYQCSVIWPANEPRIILESSVVVEREKSPLTPPPMARQGRPAVTLPTG